MYIFFNFRLSNPGSGSGIRNPDPQLEKCWIRIRIRIRIKSMRIRNPDASRWYLSRKCFACFYEITCKFWKSLIVNAAEGEQEIFGIRRGQMYNPRLFKFSLGICDLSYWVDGAFLHGMISWRPRYIERNGLHLGILCHSIQRIISWNIYLQKEHNNFWKRWTLKGTVQRTGLGFW